jgi:ABC-type nitrate/sulfonate/bicarbonate transport system substrate-binding protein
MKVSFIFVLLAAGLSVFSSEARSQGIEKAMVTHVSEAITISTLLYGIEKGFYRKEGVDLQFGLLRGDLAITAMLSREVDYMYGGATGFVAAIRGIPVKVLYYDIKSVLLYLIAHPSVQSPKDLNGKIIAIADLDLSADAARASLRKFGLDPKKDVTMILISSAATRLAALESGVVQAAIMPVPWQSRLKQKGFKELQFAGDLIARPTTALVAAREKIDNNPEQIKKVIRGFLRARRAFKQEKKEVVEFIGRKYNLDPHIAEETYGVVLQAITDDGTVSNQILEDELKRVKGEIGVQKEIAMSNVVDFRLLKEALKQVER